MLENSVDRVISLSGSNNGLIGDVPVEELKVNMLSEFPSLIVVFTLLLTWVNTVMIFRLQPLKVKERLGVDMTYFKVWKAPEWLVWPTIAIGGVIVFAKGIPYGVGLNLLKLVMVVYGLQGLSILAFVLDQLRVQGLFRTFIYLVTTLFMTPVRMGFGFFDLWFDFRSKFRQS